MHLVRKTRRIAMLVGAGATAAYFLDPDNGAARREHVLDQIRELTERNELLGNRSGVAPFSSSAGEQDETAASLPPLDEPISPFSGDTNGSSSSDSAERHLVGEALSGQHSDTI